jgi:hypothetical protein
MNKKIVSFGDSFVYGSEQKNNEDGSLGWPGRVAKNLGVEYQTLSWPGCGNDYIARQIYSYFSSNTADNTLAVINWTWAHRWDFYILEHETWITLGPTCVPETLNALVERTQAEDMIEFYRTRVNAGIMWNNFRNLQTIYSVQSYLKHKNVDVIQTYMDNDLFDIDCQYKKLTPDYNNELQQLVYPAMENFEGQNFVDWSKSKGFTVTNMLHPLEEAHVAACDLWIDTYAQALKG